MLEIDHNSFKEFGWEEALYGARCSWGSWDSSDTLWMPNEYNTHIGKGDMDLLKRLSKAGASHRKFCRMVHIQCRINAPLYWWKQFDTYKVGTVANSTSTMHTLTSKPIDISMFEITGMGAVSVAALQKVIDEMNSLRNAMCKELEAQNHGLAREYENTIFKLLPESFKQLRVVDMNLENVIAMIDQRASHKLPEWDKFIWHMRNCLSPQALECIDSAIGQSIKLKEV